MTKQKQLVLFENTIRGLMYVRLDMEFSSNEHIQGFKVDVLSVIESLSNTITYLNLKFIDEVGDFLSRVWIPPNAIFTLSYGKDEKTTKTSTFKMSALQYKQLNDSKMHPILVELTLVSDVWEELILNTHSRSWTNKKYSTVVADIATEIGVTATDIQPTHSLTNVLQPDWTNLHLLKWITKQAESDAHRGQYMCSIDRNGRFIFKTMDDFFSKKSVKSIYFNNASQLVNDGTLEGFNWFSTSQQYMPVITQGGAGMETFYFDFETKTFKTSKLSITDRPERQLSDWQFLSSEHAHSVKRYDGGRNPQTDIVATNRMLSAANGVYTMDFYIEADYELNIGDIIEVLMPTQSVYRGVELNDQYAGHWMIHKLVNSFNVTTQTKFTHLFLVRNGINGSQYTGLTKSATGKKITK